jgi:hypothetical protein
MDWGRLGICAVPLYRGFSRRGTPAAELASKILSFSVGIRFLKNAAFLPHKSDFASQ